MLLSFHKPSELDNILPQKHAALLLKSSVELAETLLCDNGAISSVIQSTNQSRVPSSRPRADVHLE